MKIIVNENYLEQEIFELVHLFLQDSEYDENKPYIEVYVSLNKRDLFLNYKIEFDDEILQEQKTILIDEYKNELEQKRYIKRAVKKELYLQLSKK